MFEKSLPALGFLKYLFLGERVSVVVPCFNECATVGHVVAIAKSSPLVDEVIVVDDGSSDDSSAVAKDAGARVVRHSRNKGKGAAILSGARAARNSVLVFVDADFVNLGSEAIESLALPVLEREAELCKASFDRSGGRVTELTAKPLLEFLFPEVSLQQPLSGQFAVRKKLLKQLDVSNDWGIDIGILLDSIKRGERVIEVNIGRVEHKHRSLSEVAATSREVTKTILEKAGFLAKKHKLVLFDFDRTLVAGSSIEALAEGLGFTSRLEAARK
ncbi:TPA: glycosyltransferase, partial [Candidatus Micrarchaeota archaeon]|nr:glycosyltransferase [Candidatus Micrarchaeota archaeon]